ncbi:hypothetical protein PPMP20_36050 [Paraburkholderia phymatum]|uniref:hypothetical protein n=1 Tax=Paraburkholderia phymatum TaxID=148447 RepID=UPI001FC99F8C|nr:hypothetical protein [Paraburkholderia phymatum]
MAKQLIYGLLAIAFAGPALAGGRYVEVWNPPEARSAAPMHAKKAMVSGHRSEKRRQVSVYGAASQLHGKPRAAISAENFRQAPAHPAAASAAYAAPTFDEIPRQITPEGNVLRVKGGRERVDVVR